MQTGEGQLGMQDVIYNDGLYRIAGGKNLFTLPYANTYRCRKG
jgi:hypothetical protein